MADNDRTLDFVNALVGVFGGVAGIVIALSSSLPQSSMIPICLAAGCIIATPFIVRHASNRLPANDRPMLRRVGRALWLLTLVLLALLIAAHVYWASIPARIQSSATQPPFTDLQMGQFDVSEPSNKLPGLIGNPGTAFDEWEKADAKERRAIPIVGILEKQAPRPGGLEFAIRIYPAATFFSIHRGPVPHLESLLDGWLVIFAIAGFILAVFLPWLNDRFQPFRESSGGSSPSAGAGGAGP